MVGFFWLPLWLASLLIWDLKLKPFFWETLISRGIFDGKCHKRTRKIIFFHVGFISFFIITSIFLFFVAFSVFLFFCFFFYGELNNDMVDDLALFSRGVVHKFRVEVGGCWRVKIAVELVYSLRTWKRKWSEDVRLAKDVLTLKSARRVLRSLKERSKPPTIVFSKVYLYLSGSGRLLWCVQLW